MAAMYVDSAKSNLWTREEKEDPLWDDLVAESKLCDKLKHEYQDSKVLYMLQKKTSKEDFENKLKEYGERYSPIVTKWSKKYNFTYPYKVHSHNGMNESFIADLVTKQRNYFSSLMAELNVNAARWKFGDNIAAKEELWADLVAESKLCEKLHKDYQDSKLHYTKHRLVLQYFTSEEDFEHHLFNLMKETDGPHYYSDVVTKWLKRYGFTLLDGLNI